LEDNLMRLFGSDRIMNMMNTLGMEEGQAIEHPLVSRAIEIAQKRVETHNFEIRKQLLEYDNVMNRQREVVYELRRSILEGENIKERVLDGIHNAIRVMVPQYLFSGEEVQWDIEGLVVALKATFRLDIQPIQKDLVEMTQEQIEELISEKLYAMYEQKEKDIGIDQMRRLERIILLQTIDSKWKDHLYAMDQLKEGIGLRAFAHKDPLVEYQHEAFGMFEMMYDSIMQDVVETVFKVEPAKEEANFKNVFNSLPQEFVHTEFSSLDKRQAPMPQQPTDQSSSEPAREPQVRSHEKVGRNDPCPCGSGKKYKKCCGR